MSGLASGALYKFLEGRGAIDVHYETDAPQLTLGGPGNPTWYSIVFESPFDARNIEEALVEVAVSYGYKEPIRWKLSFSDVVVTREFKPTICVEHADTFYCKLVYNVKPIITSKPNHPLKLAIRYYGSREFTLQQVGLILVARDARASTVYAYYSGILVLRPGDSYTVKIPENPPSKPILRIIASFPTAKNYISVMSDSGKKLAVIGGAHIRDVLIDVEGGNIKLSTENNSMAILSSLLVYASKTPKPKLKANITEIADGTIRVNIANVGDEAAENVIINVIAVGTVIDRKLLERLDAGSSTEVSVRGKPGAINTIRIVWRYKGKTFFEDYKVRI